MNNFIPPVNGTKLGELNLSWYKRRYYQLLGSVKSFLTFSLYIGILFLIIKIEVRLKFINPEWIYWLTLISFIGITAAFAWMDLSYKIKDISDKKIALFLVKNGVEINDHFIPFKDTNNYNFDGVVSFKLDGDYLRIRTERGAVTGSGFFILAYNILNENEMNFKIESKYAFCKDELLYYLNNLISEN